MRVALPLALAISIMPPAAVSQLTAAQASEEARLEQKPIIVEVVFRAVIAKRCQRFLCLLALEGEPVPEAIMRKLTKTGKIVSASKDDLVIDDKGAARGFSKPGGGRIFQVSKVSFGNDGTASVSVDQISAPLGYANCVYSLHRTDKDWLLDPKGPSCTLS